MKEPLHRPGSSIAPILIEVRFSDDQLRAIGGYIAEAALTPQPPLPVPQAAKALGISQDTLRSRVKAGTVKRVPSSVTGTTILIPAAEISRILNPQTPD